VDLRRLRPLDVLTALFGAALIGLLWAPWFSSLVAPRGAAVVLSTGLTAYAAIPSIRVGSFNGWQSMAVDDVLFLGAGLLGIWVAVATAMYSTGAVPIAAASFATFGGLLASVLAVVRLIWPPDLGPGPTDRAVGVWLGVAAAIGLTACAVASMRDERRGAYAQVPVTPLPAPRGSGA
jgi:hypothetical protein